ncbi:DUF6777 domain-containing protein [Actinomadura vinacea]
MAGLIAAGGFSTAFASFASADTNTDTIDRMTVGTPGPSPYTPVANTDQMPGGTSGTGHNAPCDPGKLAETLQANPAKAGAWAGAQGITVQQIPGYLSQLTPGYLSTDTLIVNHAYTGGKDTGTPTVLQAGMGVLKDRDGTPVVKCNCGNPLTKPKKDYSTKDAKYTGPSWSGFDAGRITKTPPAGQTPGNGSTGSGAMKKKPKDWREYHEWCEKNRRPDVDCSKYIPPPNYGDEEGDHGDSGTTGNPPPVYEPLPGDEPGQTGQPDQGTQPDQDGQNGPSGQSGGVDEPMPGTGPQSDTPVAPQGPAGTDQGATGGG